MDGFDKFTLIFMVALAFGGTLFLTIAYREWRSCYSIVTDGIETQGTVIETYRKPRRGNEPPSTAEAPVVQFATQNGEVRKYYSTLFTTPCGYQPGEQVHIWYLPNSPEKATLSGKDAWVMPIVFGLFGAVMCLIAYPSVIRALLKIMFKN